MTQCSVLGEPFLEDRFLEVIFWLNVSPQICQWSVISDVMVVLCNGLLMMIKSSKLKIHQWLLYIQYMHAMQALHTYMLEHMAEMA